MSILSTLKDWYHRWRHPVRLSPKEAREVLTSAYRHMLDEATGLPSVMRGETQIATAKMYEEKNAELTDLTR